MERDPDDDDSRLFLPLKNNIAKDSAGLRFSIEGEGIPRIEWQPGAVDISADEILSRTGEKPDGSVLEDAKEWLRETLSTGRMNSNDLFKQGEARGFSKRTLHRAKKEMGIKARKSSFVGSWLWSLPDECQNAGKAEECQDSPKVANNLTSETWQPSATLDEECQQTKPLAALGNGRIEELI